MRATVSYVLKVLAFCSSCWCASTAFSATLNKEELEYGTVLFDFHQKDYFNALIEMEYNKAIRNDIALSSEGSVLTGGMLLSYGVPDEAYTIFTSLLNDNESVLVRNRAWYYLAKLYYSKSNNTRAIAALSKVQGEVPQDIHLQYHYLASLIELKENHLGSAQKNMDKISRDTPIFPYLQFNMAIGQLRNGNLTEAVSNLEGVTSFAGQSEELSVLADRAKHGLSQLAIQSGHYPQAWTYLQGIRTGGLYSNRALLTYAWASIKLERFNDAVPALEILNSRSIAIPEVQEAKVLLSHLYEQQGAPRQALKANLLAEKEFKKGVQQLNEARRIIGLREVPREFINNLEAIVNESDWYGSQPSVNYKTLTPFLVDLMASNAFNETLKELADLYAIHDNLSYWDEQAKQHLLVLTNSREKSFSDSLKESLEKSVAIRDKLAEQSRESKLYSLTLEVEEQERFEVLLQSMSDELALLDDKIKHLQGIKAPYEPPKNMGQIVSAQHKSIKQQLTRTEKYIAVLEPIMRDLVNAELDKHEDRMRYYWAQSRLAKARLYDSTLLELEKARPRSTQDSQSAPEGNP